MLWVGLDSVRFTLFDIRDESGRETEGEIEITNSILGHDSLFVRLYWARENLD